MDVSTLHLLMYREIIWFWRVTYGFLEYVLRRLVHDLQACCTVRRFAEIMEYGSRTVVTYERLRKSLLLWDFRQLMFVVVHRHSPRMSDP